MNKKLVIGGIVLLLIAGGGAFLLLDQRATKPSLGELEPDTIPTQWSQAGDYEIKEVAGQQTVVTNSEAGFSFKVPEGWKLEKEQFTEKEFLINLLSPDATKKALGSPLSEGCGIGFSTFFQEDLWSSYSAAIMRVQDPESIRDKDEVVNIGQYPALKTTLIAETDEIRKKIGDNTQIRIPIANNGVIEFGITIMPKRKGDCWVEFDNFLSSFSIE